MVDRYAITTGGVYNHNLGEWVKVSDYEKLKAERDALKAELAAISQAQRDAYRQEDD